MINKVNHNIHSVSTIRNGEFVPDNMRVYPAGLPHSRRYVYSGKVWVYGAHTVQNGVGRRILFNPQAAS